LDNRAQTALVALRQILRATESNVRSLAAFSGLTASQLLTLQLLKKQGETLAGELARAAQLRQATMSALLDKLQARGFIRRRRSQADKRRVWVSITREGEEMLKGAPDLLQEVFLERFNKLPDWEQAFLIAALERISSLLDAEEIDASPLLHIGAVNQAPGVGQSPATAAEESPVAED
jgi:DNA-binding MarR family transcriptional regulator